MRTPLFDRRSSMRYEVMHGDEKFLVTVGFYPDGRPGEVFTHMRARRVSSAYEALARDVAILISLCLQHGEPLEDLRRVVTRDEPGAPASLAGAIIDSQTLRRAAALNLVPATFLENNDSTGFFRLTNDLVVCGPTGTNVNDFRAIVVDSAIKD